MTPFPSRAAVAGGSAGGGCGGGVVSSAAEARPSYFSLAGGTAAELLPLLFFLPRTFSFPISVLTGGVGKLAGGTVTRQIASPVNEAVSIPYTSN
jgi:hypothetical protein